MYLSIILIPDLEINIKNCCHDSPAQLPDGNLCQYLLIILIMGSILSIIGMNKTIKYVQD